jgi:hypothetical protein
MSLSNDETQVMSLSNDERNRVFNIKLMKEIREEREFQKELQILYDTRDPTLYKPLYVRHICRGKLRPMYLLMIRENHIMSHFDHVIWEVFLQESTGILITVNLRLHEITDKHEFKLQREYKYLSLFKTNLKKYRYACHQMCLQNTLRHYEGLPRQLPLALRSRIVRYIAYSFPLNTRIQ